jgi:ElaB/YqjD/DUF883 family membrane-anchored ribosome-binding protein
MAAIGKFFSNAAAKSKPHLNKSANQAKQLGTKATTYVAANPKQAIGIGAGAAVTGVAAGAVLG